MRQIILNEWKSITRDRTIFFVVVLFLLSLGFVTYSNILKNRVQIESHHVAHNHIRSQWDNMEPTNPHGAAHFGTFAFKPVSILSSIDEGINGVTGNVLQLEGHTQNELTYSEATQSLNISKFGKLKPSLLLQMVIPLFLIFISFNAVSKEKENGRIRILLQQGISLKQLVLSKSLAYWVVGLLLLSFTILVQFIFSAQNLDRDILLRLILLFSAYSIYYFIIVSLSVYLSSRLNNQTGALAGMVSVWIIWTILIPKLTGNFAEKVYPLPSRIDFVNAMREDRSKGIDGHSPSNEREEELKKTILTKYEVDSLSQLPINFDGLVMQADEEYGNMVWDKHFGNNYNILLEQKKLQQLSGFLNPFSALQNLSMGSSGSDLYHHLAFLEDVETYRRGFIKELNDKHAYGGSKTGEWDWKADQEFFRSIADYSYISPSFDTIYQSYFFDFLWLWLWIGLVLGLIFFTKISDITI